MCGMFAVARIESMCMLVQIMRVPLCGVITSAHDAFSIMCVSKMFFLSSSPAPAIFGNVFVFNDFWLTANFLHV